MDSVTSSTGVAWLQSVSQIVDSHPMPAYLRSKGCEVVVGKNQQTGSAVIVLITPVMGGYQFSSRIEIQECDDLFAKQLEAVCEDMIRKIGE